MGAAIGLVAGRAVIEQRAQSHILDHLAFTGDSIALAWRFR